MALWVSTPLHAERPEPAFATSHGDSLLFACATIMLIARFAEQPVRRNALRCLVILPLLVGGMVANNGGLSGSRSAAAIVMLLVYIRRQTRLKRFLTRTASRTRSAGPGLRCHRVELAVRHLRPREDIPLGRGCDVDRSTLFRDIENYNLLYTLRQNPFFGTGFGHPFVEVVKDYDISFLQGIPFPAAQQRAGSAGPSPGCSGSPAFR